MAEKSCSKCRQPIRDPFIMQIGSECWHESCLSCQVCKFSLKESCFKRDGKLLCKNDYERLYGIKCSVCNQLVPSKELIMRVLGNIYHLRCFLCSFCGHPLQKGEQFIIRNGQLICSMDFDRDPYGFQQCMSFTSVLGCMEKIAGDENMMLIAHAHSASDTARRGPKRPRTILTSHQRRAFKTSFEVSPKPCRKVRESLAKDLGLSVRVVQVRSKDPHVEQAHARPWVPHRGFVFCGDPIGAKYTGWALEVWFQNQRAKIKKLQRRQQQVQQSKTAGDGKDPTDEDDSVSLSSADDSDSAASDAEKVVPSKKSKKVKPKVIKQKSRKSKASVFESTTDDFSTADFAPNPYSLDSLTSFSVSPDTSSICEGNLENALQELATRNPGAKAKSSTKAIQIENPIDGLYSMHSSYFDT